MPNFKNLLDGIKDKGRLSLVEQVAESCEGEGYDSRKVSEQRGKFYINAASTIGQLRGAQDEAIDHLGALVKKYGEGNTLKILEGTARIKDKDFPGQNNVAIIYLCMMAGNWNHRNPENDQKTMNEIRRRYHCP